MTAISYKIGRVTQEASGVAILKMFIKYVFDPCFRQMVVYVTALFIFAVLLAELLKMSQ